MTLTTISRRHPWWHPYKSHPGGLVWAATDHFSEGGGCGMTLDADTPEDLEKKIDAYERDHHLVTA